MIKVIFILLFSVTLSAQGQVTAVWDANPEPDIAGYRLRIDGAITDVGKVTTATVSVSPGDHVADVQAYNTSGQSGPFSTPPVPFTVAQVCTPPTIVVSAFPATLHGGDEGVVTARVNASNPVTQMQILLGTQVVGQIDGTELRFIRAIGFGSPRIAGTYNLFVAAKDSLNCPAKTTLQRTLTIVVP